MAKNKTVRVAEKHRIDDENTVRYYSNHHDYQKKGLEVCDQAVSICYSPLFPRIAKKS